MESKIKPRASFINLGGMRLESHVREALELAWRLAGGRPVAAAHLLSSAVHLARGSGSGAFRKLASLLPLKRHPFETAANVPPPDMAALPFAPALARSFQIAESFLTRVKRVWGRDYVTLAVLAGEDPSLAEVVAEAGTTVDELRAAWLEYVRTDDRHRPPDEWERWWRAAGVPISGEAAAKSQTGEAYLLTWNPSLYPPSKIEPPAAQCRESGSAQFGWSTGNRRSMAIGSRVFLLRQGGPGPRGLVGVGETVGDVEEKPHWREDERQRGKKSLIVEVRWEALAVEPLIDLSSLVSLTGEKKLWASPAGGVTIDPAVLEGLESAWKTAWVRHKGGLGGVVVPDVEPKQLIARFNADRGAVDDSLNIGPYVSAFARVMASQELTPPLSIGLFGDWGTGKTYFMDCLHDEIEALSGGERADPDLYWPRICQVRFNAWHYAETDLWASLVNTIFDHLRKFLDGPDDKKKNKEEHFNKLLNKLEIARALRKEAEAARVRADKKLKAARKRLEAAEKTLRELPPPKSISDDELRAILGKSVSEAVGVPAKDLADLLRQAAAATGSSTLQQAAEELETGKKTVEEARDLLEQTRIAASRAGFWWRILSSAKLHRAPGFWVWVAVLVAIPVALFYFADKLPPAAEWAGVLAEALTAIATAVAWARSRLAEAAPVFDRLGALQTSVEQRIQEARDKDQLVYKRSRDEAELREKQAREELAAMRDQLQAAREEEEEARLAVRDSTSQARLGRFVRDRATSADYEKYLGLITMIHRDFEKLSGLMEDSRGEKPPPDVPRIDRIVLYIDDLDRCYPPEKVVRVLEAVHLLLFFPLFVVVVGVDSRWVSRSLNRYYRGMLADESFRAQPGVDTLRRAPADSQDFLEKIFQVPFWLRRMHPAAVRDMIHDLITAEEVELAEELGLETEPPGEDEVDDYGLLEPPPDGEEMPPPDSSLKPSRARARRVTAEAEVPLAGLGEPEIPPTEGLRIGEAELDFMGAVAPLMPRTPRSVKRFVNIYRLYKAALSTNGLGLFMGTAERPGNFRAVQVLLALVTGTPAFAKAVVAALEAPEDAESRRLSDLVDSLGVPDETWQTTLEALREFARGEYDLEIGELREVSPLVCRYSVHHMVSSQPGESSLG